MIIVIKAKNKVLKCDVVAYDMAKEKLITTMHAGRNNFITSRKVNLNSLPKQPLPPSPAVASVSPNVRPPKRHKRKTHEASQEEKPEDGREKEVLDQQGQKQGGEAVAHSPAEKKAKRKPKKSGAREEEETRERQGDRGTPLDSTSPSAPGIQSWFSTASQPGFPPSESRGKKAGRGGRGGGFKGRGARGSNSKPKRNVEELAKPESI